MENMNSKPQNGRGHAKPIHYIATVLIILVIGLITTWFGDFANPENYIDNPTDNIQSQFEYNFINTDALESHFEKHGKEFGYTTKEEYLQGANDVINNPSVLHKVQNDGDDCYYLKSTDEFVVVSPEGNIRTYFRPGDGNSTDGLEYFNRQMKTVYHFW